MSAATAEKATTQLAPSQAPVALTPMDLLDRATTAGASPEIIEKYMALQERWEATQNRKAFDAAIALAKAEIKPITRTKLGHNSKKYLDFAVVAREVDPILSRHGLAYRFRTTQTERINVTCILFGHGHAEESSLSGPPDKTGSKNDIQAIGSTLTYLQRYSLVQMLGLAAADDDDGKAGAAGGVISDEQAGQLRTLITETKTNLDRFLKWAKAESISDIPASKFNEAVAFLNQKKTQKQAEPQS